MAWRRSASTAKRGRSLLGQSLVLGVVAGGIASLLLGGGYLAYVKPGMRWPLVASAVVLAVLALATANRADRLEDESEADDASDHDHDHGHDHERTPAIGWLLLVPVLCIAVVPLRPLGADAVSGRTANVVATARSSESDLANVSEPPAGGRIKVLDFVDRAVNDPKRPYTEPVTLVGFVVADPAVPDGFVVARFVMSCCAADAQALGFTAVTDEPMPAPDTWVEVVGLPDPANADVDPGARAEPTNIRLIATSVTPVPEPAEPYESL
jgi:uncharacterized repeat protein (TIGR03943 family)